MGSVTRSSIHRIECRVRRLCAEAAAHLPFHGWHHVQFVRTKAVQFAAANGADASVVEAAALVHDVNYVVRRASSAGAGRGLRGQILAAARIAEPVVRRIEEVVTEAEMRTRHRHISLEAQALSDADTLFKALPITPVVLAHRYLAENGVTLRELADKIVGEQRPVHDDGFYFYDPTASATYARWASANLELWSCIRESLDDPNVTQLLASVP